MKQQKVAMADEFAGTYQFGPFRFDARNRLLTRDGEPVHLTPKAADVLLGLLEAEGNVVGTEELLQKAWPGTFGVDGNLAFQINSLRKALGAGVDGQRYVVNIPRRGYRIGVPVTRLPPASPDVSIPEQIRPGTALGEATDKTPSELPIHVTPVAGPAEDPRLPAATGIDPANETARRRRGNRLRRWPIAAALGGALVGVAVVLSIGWGTSLPLRVVGVTQVTRDGRAKNPAGQLVSDGSRIVFHELRGRQGAIAASNGEELPMPVPQYFRILDVSLTRSEYLATRPDDHGAERALWSVPFGTAAPWRVREVTVEEASWSSDGQHIAFVQEKTLYVVKADGADVRNLMTFSGTPYWVRWSPDGRSLRFTVFVRSDRAVTKTLWEIKADGSGGRMLPTGSSGAPLDCCGNWTPDGNDFIFQSTRDGRTDLWSLHRKRGVLGQVRDELIQLTSGPLSFSSPIASQDGKRIFAFGTDDRAHLARYDSHARELTPYLGGLAAFAVDFSRDDRWLAYVMYPELTLWRARVDGTERKQLTFAPMTISGCSWSPDGTQIAVRGKLPGKHDKVYLVPANGGPSQPLTDDDAAQGIPSWSKDGTQLAFGDVPETVGRPTGSEVIQLYDRLTHKQSVLPDSQGLWTSRWSPDGRYVAAVTIQGHELRLFDFRTKRWKGFDVPDVNHPTWSRDSQYLYFDDIGGPGTVLKRLRVADGTVDTLVDLTDGPTRATDWVGVTPDGSPLITRDGGTQVYALEVERR